MGDCKTGTILVCGRGIALLHVSGEEADTVSNPSLTTLSPWEKFCLAMIQIGQRAAFVSV